MIVFMQDVAGSSSSFQPLILSSDMGVVEEEVPVVTVDTTEDTQTFQTDQDEERELGGGQEAERSRSLATKFDTTGNVLVGDKFTRVKKINDVTESLVKTEALQNLGDIALRLKGSQSL